jgi:hypothetical protein
MFIDLFLHFDFFIDFLTHTIKIFTDFVIRKSYELYPKGFYVFLTHFVILFCTIRNENRRQLQLQVLISGNRNPEHILQLHIAVEIVCRASDDFLVSTRELLLILACFYEDTGAFFDISFCCRYVA